MAQATSNRTVLNILLVGVICSPGSELDDGTPRPGDGAGVTVIQPGKGRWTNAGLDGSAPSCCINLAGNAHPHQPRGHQEQKHYLYMGREIYKCAVREMVRCCRRVLERCEIHRRGRFDHSPASQQPDPGSSGAAAGMPMDRVFINIESTPTPTPRLIALRSPATGPVAEGSLTLFVSPGRLTWARAWSILAGINGGLHEAALALHGSGIPQHGCQPCPRRDSWPNWMEKTRITTRRRSSYS